MRILIDLQGAQSESRFRGIGRYSLSLALAVARDHHGHDVHIALNGAFPDSIASIRAAFRDFLPPSSIHVWQVPLPVDGMDVSNRHRIDQAELIREAALASIRPDVIHVASLFEGYGDASVGSLGRVCDVPTVVTLYDLIPLMNPATYLDPAPAYRHFYERRLGYLRQADALVAISESAASEAREVLGFDPARVFNISGACDVIFQPLSKGDPSLQHVRSRFGLDGRFLLYTGGSDERKNLKRLVQAFALLLPEQRMQVRLVMAGKMHPAQVDQIKKVAAKVGLDEGQLLFTGYVSDAELVALYNLCEAFVFPSWHEGFGLPVLEAMRCGAAVLAADASSIREIATRRDAMFDPMDVGAIRDCMAQHLGNEPALMELRAYGLERATHFSWSQVAQALIAACERAASLRTASVHTPGTALQRVIPLLSKASTDTHELPALADALDRSLQADQPTLFIDVTELAEHDHRTGIQRVTRAIAGEWLQSPPAGYSVQLVRIDRAGGRYVCANEFMSAIAGVDKGDDTALVCHAGDVFLGLDLVADTTSLVREWFEHFHRVGVRVAFVIYDILPVRHPEWWPGEGGRHHEQWLRAIIGYSDQVICISKTVGDDVALWMEEQKLPHRPTVSWFHLGADIAGSAPSSGLPGDCQTIVERIGAATSFLMVGTLEPRKGHAQALAAFEILWSKDIDVLLVIVGKRGWLVDKLCDALASHPERGRRLIWLEAISDQYLQKVYAASSCLLAASQGEGFGLPLIEAAQRAMPVLARDIPVFREVAGAHAAYFDGIEPAALADAVLTWIEAQREAANPDIRGLPWLTWRESAKQLETVLGLRSSGERPSVRDGV